VFGRAVLRCNLGTSLVHIYTQGCYPHKYNLKCISVNSITETFFSRRRPGLCGSQCVLSQYFGGVSSDGLSRQPGHSSLCIRVAVGDPLARASTGGVRPSVEPTAVADTVGQKSVRIFARQ
jgi:hypothetical protein